MENSTREKIKKYIPLVGYLLAIFILAIFYYPTSDKLYDGIISEVFFGFVHGVTAFPNYIYSIFSSNRVLKPNDYSVLYNVFFYLGFLIFAFKIWNLIEKLLFLDKH